MCLSLGLGMSHSNYKDPGELRFTSLKTLPGLHLFIHSFTGAYDVPGTVPSAGMRHGYTKSTGVRQSINKQYVSVISAMKANKAGYGDAEMRVGVLRL